MLQLLRIIISTPKAENDKLPELVLAATTAPAGNVKERVSVAVSEPGIVLPRIRKDLPLDAGLANSFEGITIKL